MKLTDDKIKFSNFFLWLGLFSLLLFSAGGTFYWLEQKNLPSAPASPEISVAPTPSPTPDPLAPIGIALLGYGGGNHAGGTLTDSIIVAKIIPRLQQVLLISIPRDLWVTLPEIQTQAKINTAYAIGFDQHLWPTEKRPSIYQTKTAGGELAKTTLSQIVNFPIQQFVAVSFAGFTQAINNLGGVSVKVPLSFTDDFYPLEGQELATCDKSDQEIKALTATLSGFQLEQQFTCRYEKLTFEAGIQTLDATTSLKFVRSRHSEIQGNDFNRNLRQQALIQGIKQKFMEPSFWPKIPNLVKQIIKVVDTDITPITITNWMTTFPNLNNYQIFSFGLTPTTGLVASRSADRQFILVPAPEIGWDGLKAQLKAWEASVATRSTQFNKSAVQSSP